MVPVILTVPEILNNWSLLSNMANYDDHDLVETFLVPVRKCAAYRPAFGQSNSDGVNYEQFEHIYGDDPFYSLIGLTVPSVYAAHRAAGGMTSMYRQLGIGAERLFRAVLSRQLGLTAQQLVWSYEYPAGKVMKVHTLDARLTLDDLHEERRETLAKWMAGALTSIRRPVDAATKGVVFEVRQGYKSADSKRQNADLRFGLNAYQARMLPAFAIFSKQVSVPVVERYRNDGMIVLTGLLGGDVYRSTFTFLSEIAGYDLIAFFERNREVIRTEVQSVVKTLLTPE